MGNDESISDESISDVKFEHPIKSARLRELTDLLKRTPVNVLQSLADAVDENKEAPFTISNNDTERLQAITEIDGTTRLKTFLRILPPEGLGKLEASSHANQVLSFIVDYIKIMKPPIKKKTLSERVCSKSIIDGSDCVRFGYNDGNFTETNTISFKNSKLDRHVKPEVISANNSTDPVGTVAVIFAFAASMVENLRTCEVAKILSDKKNLPRIVIRGQTTSKIAGGAAIEPGGSCVVGAADTTSSSASTPSYETESDDSDDYEANAGNITSTSSSSSTVDARLLGENANVASAHFASNHSKDDAVTRDNVLPGNQLRKAAVRAYTRILAGHDNCDSSAGSRTSTTTSSSSSSTSSKMSVPTTTPPTKTTTISNSTAPDTTTLRTTTTVPTNRASSVTSPQVGYNGPGRLSAASGVSAGNSNAQASALNHSMRRVQNEDGTVFLEKQFRSLAKANDGTVFFGMAHESVRVKQIESDYELAMLKSGALYINIAHGKFDTVNSMIADGLDLSKKSVTGESAVSIAVTSPFMTDIKIKRHMIKVILGTLKYLQCEELPKHVCEAYKIASAHQFNDVSDKEIILEAICKTYLAELFHAGSAENDEALISQLSQNNFHELVLSILESASLSDQQKASLLEKALKSGPLKNDRKSSLDAKLYVSKCLESRLQECCKTLVVNPQVRVALQLDQQICNELIADAEKRVNLAPAQAEYKNILEVLKANLDEYYGKVNAYKAQLDPQKINLVNYKNKIKAPSFQLKSADYEEIAKLIHAARNKIITCTEDPKFDLTDEDQAECREKLLQIHGDILNNDSLSRDFRNVYRRITAASENTEATATTAPASAEPSPMNIYNLVAPVPPITTTTTSSSTAAFTVSIDNTSRKRPAPYYDSGDDMTDRDNDASQTNKRVNVSPSATTSSTVPHTPYSASSASFFGKSSAALGAAAPAAATPAAAVVTPTDTTTTTSTTTTHNPG